ncbi:MAG: RHS repeat-associated core domain-containing protein [Bacteroidota bacterium]
MRVLQSIIYSCALLMSFFSYASEEQYNERLEGTTNLHVGSSFELFDDKYFDMATNPLWSEIFRHRSVKNYVRLGINPGVVQTSNFNGSMVVKVSYEKWTANGFVVIQVNRTLNINYSTDGNAPVDDLSTFSFEGAHRIKVEVVSMTDLDGDRVYLESGINVDRVYEFDRSVISNVGHRYIAATGLPTTDFNLAREFEFNWSTKQGAEFYELEWVYINDYSLNEGIYKLTTALPYNYYLNSTRIETTNTFYRIPNIFNHGYVLYRVRGIGAQGADLDKREDGLWNIAESGTVASHPSAYLIQIDHEYDPDMNWTHQVLYTEGGKRFEAVSFSDGLGRSRQSISRNTETNQVVVSNVYYDELGRVAVSDLPTPVNGSYMHHFKDFNRSEILGEPSYNKDYFYLTSGSCPLETQGFSPNFGAGKYYSPNNPNQQGENAQIPDAEHFPFNSVSYLNDFTGRVDKVGAAGKVLTLGQEHEIQYWYPSTNQSELNELFGVEVGDYSHYQKIATVDANGQIYVEISDMAGRIVASYMEGAGPSSLATLDGSGPEEMTIPLLENGNSQNINSDNMFSELTYYQLIGTEGSYSFNYSFHPEQFTAPTCIPDICFDCMYDLTIEIYDNCGELKHSTLKTGLNADDILDLETCNVDENHEEPFEVPLEKGVYTIKKRLSLNLDLVDEYWCSYVENTTCITPLADLFNPMYLIEEFNCEEGENILENTPDFTGCDINKQMMLADMMPGGQYGKVNQIDGIYSADDVLSVYNVSSSNILGDEWTDVTFYDENSQPITSLTYFVNNFQEEWAEDLLPFHPEYCYLEFCYIIEGYRAYETGMNGVYDFDDAHSIGYFKPLSTSTPSGSDLFDNAGEELDPFFTSIYGDDYADDIQDRMENFITVGSTTFNIYEYAVIKAHCPGAETEAEMNECLVLGGGDDDLLEIDVNESCFKDMIWANYRELYQELKEEFYRQAQEDYVAIHGCSNALIGVVTTPPTPYTTKVSRWGNPASLPVTDVDIQSAYNTQVTNVCQQSCAEYADDWINQLHDCDFMGQYGLTAQDMVDMRLEFIALCSSGCNADHPMPASTTPTGTTIGSSDRSINDIIRNYIPTFTESALCSELLISEPKPYRSIEQMQAPVAKPIDCCGCSKVEALESEFNLLAELPEGVTTLEQYIALQTGVQLTDVDLILCACDRYCPTGGIWSVDILLPPALTCQDNSECKSCSQIQDEIEELETRIEGYDESQNYELILKNYLNEVFHFDLSFQDYEEFIGKCTASNDNKYCTTNPLLGEWGDMMKLIAMRGQLLSPTQINLESENIVYASGHLKEEENLGNLYQASVDGSELTLSFDGGDPCDFVLNLPENAGFEFNDIVSFGEVVPLLPEDPEDLCGPNYNFQVEAFYYDCGQLTSAFLTGTSSCFIVSSCLCTPPTEKLCNDPFFRVEETCYQPRLNELIQDATENYEDILTDAHNDFLADFTSKCAQAYTSEDFTLDGDFGRYQQTLYYYDQAGNLVRTIAPQGVKRLAQSNNVAINTERLSVSGFNTLDNPTPGITIPEHEYETEYKYNSYNQLISTSNPDQDGATKFWYDFYGRVIASQNPVQLDGQQYSYILYDKLDRPVEVGQIHLVNQGGSILDLDLLDYKQDDLGITFKNWVYSGTRREVTITTFDQPLSATIPLKFSNSKQENLRLRVATLAYFDVVTLATNLETDYISATHYSYDRHGNVIEQLQDVPQLVPIQQDTKSTQYEFELISGNMIDVHYQKDKPDQISHHYEYDRLNQLKEVFTTTDGVHQTRQAHYHYYDYGPLARIELGKYQVQGMDYAYTLNGWLKGMNSSMLDEEYDAGKDGISGYLDANTSVHGLFARDVLAYTIGYYKTTDDNGSHPDYKPISSTSTFEATYDGHAFDLQAPNLYNGNIRHLVTSITGMQSLGSIYEYDQLQRLKEMKTFYNTNTDNSWDDIASTDDYYSSYVYDLNGNLKNLQRNATQGLGLLMDNFEYKYTGLDGLDNASSIRKSNRLSYVIDTGTNDGTSGDIESGQVVDNYTYDKLGQLIGDDSEGISNIVWRKGDKKIKTVTRSDADSPILDFVYDPLGQRVLKIVKPRTGGVASQQSEWIYTYYAHDASGQVMGVYNLENVNSTSGSAVLTEQHLYGLERLGMRQLSKELYNEGVTSAANSDVVQNVAGEYFYEITNHLGNVNAVIKDRKIPVSGGGSNDAIYEAFVVQTKDYYPFGMVMPGRNENPTGYRYAYNGMETDPEVKGEGNSYTTEFRHYDPRLGRWLSLDPLMGEFPWMSPYVGFDNNPVIYTDPYGLNVFLPSDKRANTAEDGGLAEDGTSIESKANAGPSPADIGKRAHAVFEAYMKRINPSGSDWATEVWLGATAPGDDNGRADLMYVGSIDERGSVWEVKPVSYTKPDKKAKATAQAQRYADLANKIPYAGKTKWVTGNSSNKTPDPFSIPTLILTDADYVYSFWISDRSTGLILYRYDPIKEPQPELAPVRVKQPVKNPIPGNNPANPKYDPSIPSLKPIPGHHGSPSYTDDPNKADEIIFDPEGYDIDLKELLKNLDKVNWWTIIPPAILPLLPVIVPLLIP